MIIGKCARRWRFLGDIFQFRDPHEDYEYYLRQNKVFLLYQDQYTKGDFGSKEKTLISTLTTSSVKKYYRLYK